MKKRLLIGCLALGVSMILGEGSTVSAQDKGIRKDEVGSYRKQGIDVVQRRLIRKSSRHEFGIDLGSIPDDQFTFFTLFQGKYTYHFREGLAFEGMAARAMNNERAIIKDLANIPCDPQNPLYVIPNPADPASNQLVTDCGVNLQNPPDPLQNLFMGSLVWSPIYGKFSIFSKKIYHFDLYFVAGAGLFDNARSNRFGFNVGLGTKIFLNEWMALKLDFRNLTVRQGAPFNQIANNRLFTLGFSVLLPMKQAQ